MWNDTYVHTRIYFIYGVSCSIICKWINLLKLKPNILLLFWLLFLWSFGSMFLIFFVFLLLSPLVDVKINSQMKPNKMVSHIKWDIFLLHFKWLNNQIYLFMIKTFHGFLIATIFGYFLINYSKFISNCTAR